MNKLKTIFKENWKRIIFSYSLFIINTVLIVAYPKILGNTIDHLIAKQYGYIFYLAIVYMGVMLFSYLSNIYDTVIFSSIYRRFASKETLNQIDNNVETTKINGRISLMNTIVHFFERDMLVVFNTLIGIAGSLYFLSLVSWVIVVSLLVTGVLIIFATSYYSPKIAENTRKNNNLLEDQTSIVSTRKISFINNFLRKSQKISINLSRLNAKFSFFIQLIVYGSVTALLTYYVMFNNVTVGSVFSTYRYMFDFCNAFLGLPGIVTSYITIKDVIKRLEIEN